MKTRNELEKMNKRGLIELILANELLPKVHDNGFRRTGLTLGQVCYVEKVGKSIADKRTMFHPIIHSTIDPETEALVITVPSMTKAAAARKAALKARQDEIDECEREAYKIRDLNTAIKLSMGMKSHNNSAGA